MDNAEDREDRDGDRDEDEAENFATPSPFSATVVLEIPGLQTSKANVTKCYLSLDDELSGRRLREGIAAEQSPKILVLPIYETRRRGSEDLPPGVTEETETTAGLVLEADGMGYGEASLLYRRLGVFSASASILDELTSIQEQTTLVLV